MPLDGRLHERELVRAFIQKERQERSIYLLSHPDRRHKFTDTFAHFGWLDMRFAKLIPASTAHTSSEWVSLLEAHGSGPSVWVVSEDRAIDGREWELAAALIRIWGGDRGTILSCIPGKLAFFRGEEMRSEYLLRRP